MFNRGGGQRERSGGGKGAGGGRSGRGRGEEVKGGGSGEVERTDGRRLFMFASPHSCAKKMFQVEGREACTCYCCARENEHASTPEAQIKVRRSRKASAAAARQHA